MKVGEFIENLRQEYGMTSKEISIKLGVSVSMVCQYEQNNYNPSLATAKKVYMDYKIALHPFGEDNLKEELELNKGV